jgi:phenylacetate-coenzyme A ligase PaaK-like adenylate-forming protein
MESPWRNIWNEKIETLSSAELVALHEENFLRQFQYVLASSLSYQKNIKTRAYHRQT